MREITSDMLHRAADYIGVTQGPEDVGTSMDALQDFIYGSTWDDGDWRPDPMSMSIGISIGLVAAQLDD